MRFGFSGKRFSKIREEGYEEDRFKGTWKNPAWQSLSAVQNGRYVILPGELFHYKPNKRWGESYEYLADILYPEIPLE